MALIGFSAQDSPSLRRTHISTLALPFLARPDEAKCKRWPLLSLQHWRACSLTWTLTWETVFIKTGMCSISLFFSPPRLWNHYSPNDTSIISYELFLEKLGFCVRHNFKIAPVCTRLGKNTGNYSVDVASRQTRVQTRLFLRLHTYVPILREAVWEQSSILHSSQQMQLYKYLFSNLQCYSSFQTGMVSVY